MVSAVRTWSGGRSQLRRGLWRLNRSRRPVSSQCTVRGSAASLPPPPPPLLLYLFHHPVHRASVQPSMSMSNNTRSHFASFAAYVSPHKCLFIPPPSLQHNDLISPTSSPSPVFVRTRRPHRQTTPPTPPHPHRPHTAALPAPGSPRGRSRAAPRPTSRAASPPSTPRRRAASAPSRTRRRRTGRACGRHGMGSASTCSLRLRTSWGRCQVRA